MRASIQPYKKQSPGHPVIHFLTALGAFRGFQRLPFPESLSTGLLSWISTVPNTKVEPTISFLASHSYACYHFNNKILGSDKTQPRTHLTGKKPPTAPDTHVALFFPIPVGSGPQVATPAVQWTCSVGRAAQGLTTPVSSSAWWLAVLTQSPATLLVLKPVKTINVRSTHTLNNWQMIPK